MRPRLAPVLLGLAACAPVADEPAPSPLARDAQGHATPLACPGDPSCASADGPLEVGAAAVSITPRLEAWIDLDDDGRYDEGEPFDDIDGDGAWDPVWIAGFGLARAAREIHDELWARALVLRAGELAVGIVSLDTIGNFHDQAVRVREGALARGLALDHVIVASTHQHQGQDTMGLWGPSPLARSIDADYLRRVEAASVEALARALDRIAPATLVIAQGRAPELVRDSRPPVLVDDTFTVLQLRGERGATIATWTLWGNHPEALGGANHAVSSDYPHYLRERLEREYPGSLAVFSAGSLGGLMTPLGLEGCPDAAGVPRCREGSFAFAEYVGVGLAERAVAALARAEPEVAPTLALRRQPFVLATGNVGFATALSLGVIERQMFTPDGRPLPREALGVEDALAGRALLETEVNWLRLGSLEILLVPGELYPELWRPRDDGASAVERPAGADFVDAPIDAPLRLRLAGGGRAAIVNQANDALGYIIPKSQFDLEPPFTYGQTAAPYGEGVSNGPDTAHAVAEAVERMMRAVEPR